VLLIYKVSFAKVQGMGEAEGRKVDMKIASGKRKKKRGGVF
jgi:hypothetical protein